MSLKGVQERQRKESVGRKREGEKEQRRSRERLPKERKSRQNSYGTQELEHSVALREVRYSLRGRLARSEARVEPFRCSVANSELSSPAPKKFRQIRAERGSFYRREGRQYGAGRASHAVEKPGFVQDALSEDCQGG